MERCERLRNIAMERVQELIAGGNVPMPHSMDTTEQIRMGPRGGRYTEAVTREGRPYRRYFLRAHQQEGFTSCGTSI